MVFPFLRWVLCFGESGHNREENHFFEKQYRDGESSGVLVWGPFGRAHSVRAAFVNCASSENNHYHYTSKQLFG
jgi:hypothetical protein